MHHICLRWRGRIWGKEGYVFLDVPTFPVNTTPNVSSLTCEVLCVTDLHFLAC